MKSQRTGFILVDNPLAIILYIFLIVSAVDSLFPSNRVLAQDRPRYSNKMDDATWAQVKAEMRRQQKAHRMTEPKDYRESEATAVRSDSPPRLSEQAPDYSSDWDANAWRRVQNELRAQQARHRPLPPPPKNAPAEIIWGFEVRDRYDDLRFVFRSYDNNLTWWALDVNEFKECRAVILGPAEDVCEHFTELYYAHYSPEMTIADFADLVAADDF